MNATELEVIRLLDQDWFRRATTLDLIAELEWSSGMLGSDPNGAEYWTLEIASVTDEIERRQRKPIYTVADSSKLTKELIDEIKAKVDIVALIGRDLTLIGPWYGDNRRKAVCPFHDDHAPSFTVYPKGQTYHCFGCGAHGDAIQWLMASKSITFRDAVTRLATDVGVAIPDETLQRRPRRRDRDSVEPVR